MGPEWDTMADIGGPMYPPEPSFAPCSGASMPGLEVARSPHPCYPRV